MNKLIDKHCTYSIHTDQLAFCKVISSNANEGTLLEILYIKTLNDPRMTNEDQWSDWEPYINEYDTILIETKQLYGTQFTYYSKPPEVLKELNLL